MGRTKEMAVYLQDYNKIQLKIQHEMLNYTKLDERVSEVCEMCRVTENEMFSKTRETHIAESRFIFYSLCKKDGCKPVDILRYMKTRGYAVTHGNIVYGQKKGEKILNKIKIIK